MSIKNVKTIYAGHGHILAMFFASFCIAQCSAVAAQSPSPLPLDLQLNIQGTVRASARSPDGSIVIGGTIGSVNGVARKNLARLLSDGTLDATWNPSLAVNATVEALAVDGNGAVYANGQRFSSGTGATDPTWNHPGDCYAFDSAGNVYIGGPSQLQKISVATGLVDPNWSPVPNGDVYTLAFDTISGELYAGGRFTSIGGQAHSYIAKLSAVGTGAADPNWQAGPDWYVESIALDSTGNVFAGGGFTHMNGLPRNHIAKVSGSTGNVDFAWNPSILNGPSSVAVHALAMDINGSIYAGGAFSTVGVESRQNVAKLSASGVGAVDANWNAGTDLTVYALTNAGQSLFVGGSFTIIAGEPTSALAVLSASGALQKSLIVALPGGFGTTVQSVVVQADGSVIAGGYFLSAGALLRRCLVRILPNGTVDPIWNPGADDTVMALTADPSGNIYAGGFFQHLGGQPRNHIAKVSGSGVGIVDATWDPDANDVVYAIARGANGNVFAGGVFSNIGGQQRSFIAKLMSDGGGAADELWDAGAGASSSSYGWRGVQSIQPDGAGGLFLGGGFYGIHSTNFLTKVSEIGAGDLDLSFNPAADQPIHALILDGKGHLYATGEFTNVGGLARTYIAKLSVTTGSADPAWNSNANNLESSPTIGFDAAAGAIYVDAFHTTNSLYKFPLDGGGTPDITWNPQPNYDVRALLWNGHGTLYVGGEFTSIGGELRTGLAAFVTDGLFNGGFE